LIEKPYVSFLKSITIFVLGKKAEGLILPLRVLNIAVFVSLILAMKRIRFIERAKMIVIGCGVLFITHVVLAVFFPQQLPKSNEVWHATLLNDLLVIGQVALPFLLWIILARRPIKEMLSPATRNTSPGLKRKCCCPICGKTKAGILDHIETVHGNGRDGLGSKIVSKFVNNNPELKELYFLKSKMLT